MNHEPMLAQGPVDVNVMGLLPCPYCGDDAQRYPNSDGQANAIYCKTCPVGVEHSERSDEELATIWNGMPRTMAWQPIETAPRDGTKILLYRPLAEKTNDDPIDIKRGVPRDNGCWEETIPAGLSGENYTDGACRATHWMPLPDAPNDKFNGGREGAG